MIGKTNWKRNIMTMVLFVGVVLLAYRSMITSDFLAVCSDGVGYYVARVFFIDGIRGGELPLWDPYTVIGTPFLADVQNTVLSPFNILFFIFDSVTAFNLMYIIFMIMAGFFMYLLVYGLTDKYLVSVIAGFLFAFATVMSGRRMEHTTIIATLAFFPVVIYYLEMYRKSGREKWLILCSVTMAIQFICGFTQIVLYFDIAVFAYLLYVFFDRKLKMKEAVIIFARWVGVYILLIGIQLFPTLNIMIQSGRNKIAWEAFSVLSYDLRILLMMLFPEIYQNHFEAFGIYASSGIDIEIYVGVICLIYIIYEIIYNWKERKVKVISGIALASFIYGMIPHIPIMGKVLFHIPLLNSFRVCARSLPIFIFFCIVLAGMGMSHLNEKESVRKIIKVNGMLLGIILVVLLFMQCFLSQDTFMKGEYSEYYNSSIKGVLIALGLCSGNLFGLLICLKIDRENVTKGITLLIGMAMIIDIMRFSFLVNQMKGDTEYLLDAGVSEQVKELIDQDTSDHYRSFVVMDSAEEFYSSNFNIAKLNRNRITHNKIYNSYLTFLDEKLAYWEIDEIAYYIKTAKMLKDNIGLASMLGIHYIFDGGNHDINSKIMDKNAEYKLEYESNEVCFQNLGDILIYMEPAGWIEENATYLITITTSSEIPSIFYVDLYNDCYDDPKQNGYFDNKGGETLRAVISTDEIPDSDVFFRIIASSEKQLKISNLKIEKVYAEDTLEKISDLDTNADVYVNSQARQIIYIPDYVVEKNEWGNNWREDALYDVDRVSYIPDFGPNMDLRNNGSIIKDIVEKRNSVAATVYSDKDTFVNHAQLSYPGWRAYVDGEEVKLYTVNRLIQGIRVPQGEHHIEFRYEPNDIKIGVAATLLGIFSCCIWIVQKVKRKS